MASFGSKTTSKDVLDKFSDQAEGKTFVITGPSEGGIGAEVAKYLASAKPKKIILVGRNESKVTPVIKDIKETNSAVEVWFVEIDLLSDKSVRRAAKKIKSITDKIDVLINNAGIIAVRNYTKSVDGVESQFATNYLGHFLLTNLLAKEILAAAAAREGARIVQVGSLGYILAETNLDDYNFKDGETYTPWTAYGQSKTAMILFNVALNERLKKKNVTTLICHPGVTLDSKLYVNNNVDAPLLSEAYVLATERANGVRPADDPTTLDEAVGAVLLTALNPLWKGDTPAFIVENKIHEETKAYATNKETAAGLWKLSEDLVREEFNFDTWK